MKKDKIAGKSTDALAMQHAALCFRRGGSDGIEVLLITSLETGRWVLPKGWPKKAEKGGDCALREAFEEAGVQGQATGCAPGLFFYDKILTGGQAQPCCVAVHPVDVSYLAYRFPEMGLRHRQWVSPRIASTLVAEPELQALLAGFTLPPQTTRDPGNS